MAEDAQLSTYELLTIAFYSVLECNALYTEAPTPPVPIVFAEHFAKYLRQLAMLVKSSVR